MLGGASLALGHGFWREGGGPGKKGGKAKPTWERPMLVFFFFFFPPLPSSSAPPRCGSPAPLPAPRSLCAPRQSNKARPGTACPLISSRPRRSCPPFSSSSAASSPSPAPSAASPCPKPPGRVRVRSRPHRAPRRGNFFLSFFPLLFFFFPSFFPLSRSLSLSLSLSARHLLKGKKKFGAREKKGCRRS